MTATTDDKLWAVHEIQQLAFRYAHAFATRDRALMLSLWTETDDEARLPTLDIHRLRRDLDRWWEGLGQVMLLVSNHVIELEDDDHASGTVYCAGQIDAGHQFIDQTIVYHDRYARRDGHWRFATRTHLLWFGQERERHPLRQPPARWPRRQVGAGEHRPAGDPTLSTLAQGAILG